jgi:hypothetical protein
MSTLKLSRKERRKVAQSQASKNKETLKRNLKHREFNLFCCEMDDRGYEMLFDSKIGYTSHHTRWQHTVYEHKIYDIWVTKKGYSIWKTHSNTSARKHLTLETMLADL